MKLARCALLAAAVSALAPSVSAQAPRDPVRVTVEPLFGEGTLTSDGYSAVLVTLENVSGADLGGELDLRVETYADHAARHVAHLDLPRAATRQVVMTLFVDANASHVSARYSDGARLLGRGNASVSYAGGARSVVVLGDPPRLRGALLELDASDSTLTGPRQVRAPVGVVRFDAAGDPMLPAEVAAWSTVRLLVASAPVLARASAAQRSVIADWLRSGGRLLVFPRSAHDLDGAWLRELAGPVGAEQSSARTLLVPDDVVHFALSCSESQRTESFGCSAPVGFGRVFLASYDGASPAAIETGVPRELVRSVYEPFDDQPTSVLPFGRGRDDVTQMDYYTGAPSFGSLRVALDPNEGFRPALILVAIVLLLYVIVVGPINFRWVQKKNRPALALVTTPLAALACLALLLVVGYVGKGVSMRYRRFELVEAVEGERRAPARRYTGLFSTRPGSFDLPGTERSEIAHRIDGGGERGPVHRHEGGRVILSDFRAGLWETVFLREDRVVDLGGAIRFERDGRRLAAVVNDTPHALTSAVVVDGSGDVYVIGAVPPGARADIPRRSGGTVPVGSYYGAPEDVAGQLAEHGDVDEDHLPYLRGLVSLAVPLVPGATPVLYARAPIEGPTLGPFSPEHDDRWIRIVPRLAGSPVVPAMPPSIPGSDPTYAIPADAGTAPSDDAGVDAGEPAAAGPEVLP